MAEADTTLEIMDCQDKYKPAETHFVAAKKLRNGNILCQLNSIEAGKWIRNKEVQEAFLSSFRVTTSVKCQTFYIVAEFMPTTFVAGDSGSYTKLEDTNNLPTDTITSTKFIKSPHLRYKEQKVTHLIVSFSSRKEANTIIQQGLYIEGKHVIVRKVLTEPRRCLKCQMYGHFVSECKAQNDRCARCTEQHRTALCPIATNSPLRCANCKPGTSSGHSAADRGCPSFLEEQAKIDKRSPENKFKYFPTFDLNTWKLTCDVASTAVDHFQVQRENQAAYFENGPFDSRGLPSNNWQDDNCHRGR